MNLYQIANTIDNMELGETTTIHNIPITRKKGVWEIGQFGFRRDEVIIYFASSLPDPSRQDLYEVLFYRYGWDGEGIQAVRERATKLRTEGLASGDIDILLEAALLHTIACLL